MFSASTCFHYVKRHLHNLKVSHRPDLCNCQQNEAVRKVFKGMFMIHNHEQFHIPSSNGSFLTIKRKIKHIFREPAMLFYILQKQPTAILFIFRSLY